LYRLTGVTAPSRTTSYAYDPSGNRLTMTRGTATNYAYDRADRISTAGTTSYTVNANGNLTARGSDSFAYDQANRLKQAIVGSATTTYAWDGEGKRASATTGSNTTRWVYDASRGLPVLLEDGTRKYVWGLGLAYAVEGSNLDVYHADGLGSMRGITDGAGAVTQLYQTDEFGVPSASAGTRAQPFQYTGEPRDGETGLLYLIPIMSSPAV
ncbi:MAG: RHS repeat-associated core domain-containing protein, partial [Candidatus Rokuibacteriota bacterium]